MKGMIYGRERTIDLLYAGEYKGIEFAILNLGTHPTAYIKLNGLSADDERLDDICVHGGFTFSGKAYWDERDEDMWLGWDYAYCWDYFGWYDSGLGEETKKWTTRNIL